MTLYTITETATVRITVADKEEALRIIAEALAKDPATAYTLVGKRRG